MAAEEYYNHSTFPLANSPASSQQMRNELEAIEQGFGKLPALSGNGTKLVWINPAGTAMEVIPAFSDTTAYDVSTLAHGLAPKLPGNTTQFLRADGAWSSPGTASSLTTSSRTSNAQIVTADGGTLIRYTGSTNFTQTFALAASLTSVFYCYLHNTGTAEVELAAPGNISTTSSTSNSVSAGTTWAVTTGLAINPGDQFIARRTSDPFNQRITGTVTSYNSGTGALVANVQGRIGSGTFTDWSITTGTATIDSLPSYVMYSGEMRLLTSNGTNLITAVLAPYSITRTASGFFVKPPGYRFHGGLLWGGGGSGAKGSNSAGGGGACHSYIIPDTSLSAVTAFVIGAGGAAITGANAAGNAGGLSTFGTVNAYGGAGTVTTTSGSGGGILPVGSTLTAGGFGGGAGVSSGNGGDSMYGGGGGGPSAGGTSVYGGGGGSAAVGTGGSSIMGGAGGAGGGAGAAVDGGIPGGGGGGGTSVTQSGAGGRGELRAWGVA